MADVVGILETQAGTVALVVSLISGSFAGVGLATLHHAVTTPVRRAFVTGLVVAWLGLLFHVALMVAVLAAGDPIPAFVYALGVVWVVFSAGVSGGSFVVFRLRA